MTELAGRKRKVLFLDIDNCLYPESIGISTMMRDKILEFAYKQKIASDYEGVLSLCTRYHKDYGLAIKGLLLHHDIDPLLFNAETDDSLPLDEILKKDHQLVEMLNSIIQQEVEVWAFTNAMIGHGERVLRLLGVRDFFKGVIACDYSLPDFPCKPEARAFYLAMKTAQVEEPTDCYFVDDSAANVETAKTIGWTCVHVVNPSSVSVAGHYRIGLIYELPSVLPSLFSSSSSPFKPSMYNN